MSEVMLAAQQRAVAALPFDRRVFLEGPAGTGKTAAAIARMRHLLDGGVPAESLLVLAPQRTLLARYAAALRSADLAPGGEVTVLTAGGLAQRMIDLFWPLISAPAGFERPDRPPVFLTLETAQYFMARLVGPLVGEGYFDGVTIDRNRLFSQILDNLNKSAVVGFPITEIAQRLKSAWQGESARGRIYDDAQTCAERFRAYCLANNLLDFSLQFDVFVQGLWRLPRCRDYLLGRYAHLIVDNVEEDTPVAHDLLIDWLPSCRSALIVYDHDAGHRRFLGADPASANRLRAVCAAQVSFTDSFTASPHVLALQQRLARALGRPKVWSSGTVLVGAARKPTSAENLTYGEPAEPELAGTAAILASTVVASAVVAPDPAALGTALSFASTRFHIEMLDWAAGEIAELVRGQGIAPGEIVVLAPFMSDALRFSMSERLAELGIPSRSHRPSRALRDEPATRCLLTLAALGHPEWAIAPHASDVAHALEQAIPGLDLVRAHLLVKVAYRPRAGVPVLTPFAQIVSSMQDRITYLAGQRYDRLRDWLATQAGLQSGVPLDHFLGRLFGEILSQPGYGFHLDHDAGAAAANLIVSARKFREVMASAAADLAEAAPGFGREYVCLVEDGVVSAQYVEDWRGEALDAVQLSPAHTFLMSNRPVDHQFWLDVGSTAWWERLNQPLTHPYVLSRGWMSAADRDGSRAEAPALPGSGWTDAAEYAARRAAMSCLVTGLLRRCRRQVHLGIAEMGEHGTEQRGPLLQAIQHTLRVS